MAERKKTQKKSPEDEAAPHETMELPDEDPAFLLDTAADCVRNAIKTMALIGSIGKVSLLTDALVALGYAISGLESDDLE